VRILEDKGSRVLPAFDAETGERMRDLDLFVGLGAHFDPRRNHPGPQQIIVAAPNKLPVVGAIVDPSEVRVSRWVFTFEPRDIDGQSTLCMAMSAEGDATPFRDMPPTDKWGDFFFDLAGQYARLCR